MSGYDVIVIGGGVIGLTIARRLARDGLRITLLERGVCGAEASWAGAGILSPCNPHRKDPLFHLHEKSLAMYPALCAELAEETGINTEYEQCGELQLLFSEDALRTAHADADAAAGRTMPDGRPIYEVLSVEAAQEHAPVINPSIQGALLCRQAAQVRNPPLLRALKASCQRAGVTIRESTPIEDFVFDRAAVRGVRTAEETIHADLTILCAGAWSSQIGQRLNTVMPIHPVRGQMILLKAPQRPFTPVIVCGKCYLVPRRDGHILVGATEEHESGYSKRVTPKGLAGLTHKALELVPALGDLPVEQTWAGLRPGTPDDRPYIGPVPGFERLIAATGHFRTGLTLAPATADVVATILRGHDYDIELSVMAPGREFGSS